MNDLEQALWDAWEKVAPMLKANPDELKARLARRRSKTFLRPTRAFCIAVKASDHRINRATAAMVPDDAMDITSEWHPGQLVKHTVDVDKRLLTNLCRPVEIAPPGEPFFDVAKRLGCAPESLRQLRRNGMFRVHYVKGLAGRPGKPVPMVYTSQPLDPSRYGKRPPDPIWGCLWRMHAQALHNNFCHQLTRIPLYVSVPSSPLATGNSQLATHYEFRGWRWLCPGCKNRVQTLYYPLPVPDWAQYVGFKCADDEIDAVPRPNPCFACNRCHNIANFSRASLSASWSQLILVYSGGLLYGREVKRPAWLTTARQRAFCSRPKPAPKRDELARLLADTELTIDQIARELCIKPASVERTAATIFKRHGVKTRQELRAVLPAAPPAKAAG